MSEQIDNLHARILYPVTRVRAVDAGGSGVLVYSQPDPKHAGHYINLMVTCHHVVAKAIKLDEKWDPVLKLRRRVETFNEVTVEVFDYDRSRIVSSNSTQADIIAYDETHDLALVKLHNFREMPHIAHIIPEADIEDLRVFEKVYACGCSLLHDPFPGEGELSYLREMIDQKVYIMSSAPSIFGNSGGGLFRGSSGDLVGITSRVTVTNFGGFNLDVQTWMEFSSHPSRFYDFFREQELMFLVDPADDYYSAMDRREKRQKEALRTLLVGQGDQAPTVPSPDVPLQDLGPQD